jgi:hypothetical protein
MEKKSKGVCQEAQPGISMTLLYNHSLTPPVHPASIAIRSSSFLDNFLLKNPMNLTDEQWRLIEPILPPPSPSNRGRPPLRYPPGMLHCAPQSQTVGRSFLKVFIQARRISR